MPLTVQKTYLTNNDCYRAGRSLSVQADAPFCGLCAALGHCLCADVEPARRQSLRPRLHRCQYRHRLSNPSLDPPRWHAGGSANNTHIGVEMCEPATLHYTTGAHL